MTLTVHELKTWPQFYREVAAGIKPFEVRKDDRDYKTGDTLRLREWEPNADAYTGRECLVRETYVISLRPLYDAVGMAIELVN